MPKDSSGATLAGGIRLVGHAQGFITATVYAI